MGVSKKGINHRDKFRTAAFATGQPKHDNYRAEGWGKLVAYKFDAVAAYRDQHRSCGREPAPKRLKPTPPTYAPPTHLTERHTRATSIASAHWRSQEGPEDFGGLWLGCLDPDGLDCDCDSIPDLNLEQSEDEVSADEDSQMEARVFDWREL